MAKASTFWPGKYSARLAKALEDEDDYGAEENTERVGVLHDRDERHGSRRGKKPLNEPDRPMKVVDSSPCRLRRPENLTKKRPVEQVRKEPFRSLSKREEETGRCRKAERKTTERLIKRRLTRDIEALKREVEDLQQMVAQQASLSERRKRKRVSFHEDTR
ncbi:uncharacterized protein N7483_002579 [Penicillium malachiteum]|uniref:uncharacterized protein n=1 Tax=Penicillium malachiteum TaxID=1324776 RepID=UPI002548A4DA|nr:uncharacterized protein N7483_002579 [Penicillium malachiteum]KAJ5737454.1 hypothetical protein N7483_002579 [Penicillium malachiteum]